METKNDPNKFVHRRIPRRMAQWDSVGIDDLDDMLRQRIRDGFGAYPPRACQSGCWAHMSNDDLRQKARENWFWIAAVIAIFFGYTVGKDRAIRDRAQAAAMPCPPEAT
jgi:hypothetical protein